VRLFADETEHRRGGKGEHRSGFLADAVADDVADDDRDDVAADANRLYGVTGYVAGVFRHRYLDEFATPSMAAAAAAATAAAGGTSTRIVVNASDEENNDGFDDSRGILVVR